MGTLSGADHRRRIAERYRRVRQRSVALTRTLSAEDCAVQSMPDASPTKWHLAHTTWFFETFVLAAVDRAYKPHDERFGYLFNSYYDAVGPRHARPQRGLLTRPSLAEVMEFRNVIDRRVERLLEDCSQEMLDWIELGTHHEEQHQELVLTDIKHAFFSNPLRPAFAPASDSAPAPSSEVVQPLSYKHHPGGILEIGAQPGQFAYDNEGPRHRTVVEPFHIGDRLVTNAEYLEFIADGGYQAPEHWLDDGWKFIRAEGIEAPLYWQSEDGAPMVEAARSGLCAVSHMTLRGMQPIAPNAPVAHVSFYEANAFARWQNARLPREEEWEVFASGTDPEVGNFLESDALAPRPRQAHQTQVFGDAWEWTASPYVAYPGYRQAGGALGEYNGKFMCNQLVLRGGSCATPRDHIRTTYRNYFSAKTRWQFSGFRLVRDEH